MDAKAWGWLLGLLCSPALALGASLLVTWEDAKSGPGPTWQLTLAHTAQGRRQQQHLTLAPLDEATCQQQAGATYTVETWCARLPCPAPGVYMALLQADEGLPSAAVSFGIRSADSCQLVSAFEAQQTPDGAEAALPPRDTLTPLPARESLSPLEGSPDLPDLPTMPTVPPLPALPSWADVGEPPDVAGEIEDLERQFQALQTRYQTALTRVTTTYTDQLQARARYTQAQLVDAYRRARDQQQTLYADLRRDWTDLYAHWHRLVLGQTHVDHLPDE